MATTCFDIRRVDDKHVCIYKAGHNAFQYSYHIASSSYSKTDEEWDEEEKDGFFYDYIIVGKDSFCGNIERIIFSCINGQHAKETLEGCLDGTGIYYDSHIYDYRLIKLPMYKYVNVTFKHKRFYTICNKRYRYRRQETNILHDKFLLYCPVEENKKYKIYGTFLNKRKKHGGCYWTAPRKIKGIRHG